MFNVLQPEGWAPAKGYANGIEARGRMVFVAGMIGWNGQAQFETDDFVAQCRQALQNIVDTLACAGAGPQHMARMTWYVKDKKEYLARGRELGKVYQEVIGKNYPAMTLVQVADLVVNPSGRQVKRGNRNVGLTAREYQLLILLLERKGTVVSREQILRLVWDDQQGAASNVIEVYVRYLRQKLEEGGEKRLIHTVRGHGYCLSERMPNLEARNA